MNFFKKNGLGLLVCLAIAVPCWFLGKLVPVVGGPVFAILIGMIIALFWKDKGKCESGIKFTSKKILQWAVILLGFGLNLGEIGKTGLQSLPIILCTITTSLVLAFVLCKVMKIDTNTAVLVGVGSSICGGSAIAAAAPCIDASDEEVAQSISVIFFFNVLAALLFPMFGKLIGFDQTSGEAFGIFAGTAVNDTSSVTACASTWDSMFNLGNATLDKAVTVKLTRTLAIIPITLVLALVRTSKQKKAAKAAAEAAANGENQETAAAANSKINFAKIFPWFILYFIGASVITTVLTAVVKDPNASEVIGNIFKFLKQMSKFFIIMAMGAVGLNSNVIKLVKTGGKPLALGACCWAGITGVSLIMQHVMGLF